MSQIVSESMQLRLSTHPQFRSSFPRPGKVSVASVTVELDDFHPLALHVLTHEAEALVFKVTL